MTTPQEPQKGMMEEIERIFLKGKHEGMSWESAEPLIHHQLQKAREEERKMIVAIIKANVPLERIPSDFQKTNLLVDELMKLHYEPEHEEGQTCWCIPVTIVEPATKKVYINHNEQRIILRQFIEDNFVAKEQAIASLCLGSNQARRGILNAIKELDQDKQ